MLFINTPSSLLYILLLLMQNNLISSQLLPVRNPDRLYDIIISTDDHIVLSDCMIREEWRDIRQEITDQNFLEIYEGINNIRRSFTIEYKPNPAFASQKISITISDISISNNYPKYLNPILLSNKLPYVLNEGDSFDLIVEYNCISHWDDIKISLQIQGYSFPITFYYRKICSANYLKTLNGSYLILMCCYIIFLYGFRNNFLIHKDHFVQINIEEILQTKNIEKLLMITFGIICFIIFFIIIGYNYIITFIASGLISVISITSLVRFVLTLFFPSCIDKLESKTFLWLNIVMNYGKMLFYIISFFVFFLWIIFKSIPEMIINNLIVFIISYYAIHKLNWKKFYLFFILYLITLVYQISVLSMANIPRFFDTQIYSLTTKLVINSPIRFVLPDLVHSPYDIIYFVTIVDLVLLGFLLRYLEKSSHFNPFYMTIRQYGTFVGVFVNIIMFYGFHFAAPAYLAPFTVVMLWAIGFAIWKGEAMAFFDLDIQRKKMNEMADVPLNILGADHSEDFANAERRYLPPSIFNINEGSGSFIEEKIEMKEIKDVIDKDYIEIHNQILEVEDSLHEPEGFSDLGGSEHTK